MSAKKIPQGWKRVRVGVTKAGDRVRYPTSNRFYPIEKDEVGSVCIAFDGVIRRRGGKGAGR